MGVLDRFEKGIERAVNGAFAKAFRSEVQPVEIASALRRELDDRATIIGRGRTLVPNTFVVELGPDDHERLGDWQEALADELRAVIHDHAAHQRYAFVGPVTVEFGRAEDLDTGLFRVRSTTTRPSEIAAPERPAAGPAPYAPSPAPPMAAPAQPAAVEGWPEPVPPGAVRPEPSAPAPVAPARVGAAVSPPRSTPAPAQPAAPPAPAPLVVTLDVDGRPYQVRQPVTVVGRGVDADIVLDDPGVSRRHAEIHVMDGRARVIDLGSTNGTFVDGERVHAGVLTDGSAITIGRTRIIVHTGTG